MISTNIFVGVFFFFFFVHDNRNINEIDMVIICIVIPVGKVFHSNKTILRKSINVFDLHKLFAK